MSVVSYMVGRDRWAKRRQDLSPMKHIVYWIKNKGINQNCSEIHVKLQLKLWPPRRGAQCSMRDDSGAWHGLGFQGSHYWRSRSLPGIQTLEKPYQVRVKETVEMWGLSLCRCPLLGREMALGDQKGSQSRWRIGGRRRVVKNDAGSEVFRALQAEWGVLPLSGRPRKAGEWHGHTWALKDHPAEAWQIILRKSLAVTIQRPPWTEQNFSSFPISTSRSLIILGLIRGRTRFPISSLMDLLSSSVTTCFLACLEEHFQAFGVHIERKRFQRK